MNDKQKEIFEKYKNTFPFKIIEFIKELGILITSAELPVNVYGAIRKENNNYRIYVNNTKPLSIMRLTLAKELGHYFYNEGYLCLSEILDTSKQSSKKFLFFTKRTKIDPALVGLAKRANIFAYEILMPDEKFTEVWCTEASAGSVAEYFGVSVDSVVIRASLLLGEIF